MLRLRAVGAAALDIFNMHIVDAPNLPLHVQFGRVRRYINSLQQADIVMVGDMNLLAAGEGRLHSRTGELRSERSDRVGLLEGRFSEFAEVVADGYSRRQYRDGELDVLSRIDSALMNSHTQDIDVVRASARYVSAIVDTTVPSAHVALELVLQVARPARRNTIPRWVTDHPLYDALCAEVFAESDFRQGEPFQSIARATSIFTLLRSRSSAQDEHQEARARRHGLHTGLLRIFGTSTRRLPRGSARSRAHWQRHA